MSLELVSDDYKGSPPPPKPPKNNSTPSRREILIGAAAAAGGMGLEATFKPLRSLYRLLLGDSEPDDFPDKQVLDELEARRRNATGDNAAIDLRDDTRDQAINAGTTDPPMPTKSEETFEDRRARMEREHEARLEAGISEHIKPEKIAELERKLDAVPRYLQNLQLRFKPDGKLEAADEAKIRAFLAETLKCKPEELQFNQYERDGRQGFQKSVYIDLKEKLIASIDGDTPSDGNIEFSLMEQDLATGLRALRIELDAEGRMNRYSHELIRDGKKEKYDDYRRPSRRTQYTTTNASGQDLEKISLNYDSTGKAISAVRKKSGDYEYYYCDRAAFDEVHKK